MRLFWKTEITVCLLLAVFACQPKTNESKLATFICPMHPTVVSDSPGMCPVCHMDLVPSGDSGGNLPIGEEAALLQPVQDRIFSSAKTIQPFYGLMDETMETTGIVEPDPRSRIRVSAAFNGRIETIFALQKNQTIATGETLATIFSPDLIAAQQEYLKLFHNDRESAMQRLLKSGFPTELIQRLEKTGQVIENIPVISPVSGNLISSDGNTWSTVEATTDDMKSDAAEDTRNPSGALRQGTPINFGQLLFEILPSERRMINIQIPADQAFKISLGDSVVIETEDKRLLRATIQTINRTSNESGTVRCVSYVRDQNLPLGSVVATRLFPARQKRLWVPASSVLALGKRFVVFIRHDGVFSPRIIQTGHRENGHIEIVGGLGSGEEIAEQAGLLIDTDAFLFQSNEHD